ncbi:OsmC family protein [Pontibacter kalidii]|uniref:OsmC family protein n=1 Tax=Pontibacter kalidii TaxID=2592049 RepID=UPI002259AFA6|nr:OsmC family protein [Pontibacter kalidii]
MTITATVKNAYEQHEATVSTNSVSRQVSLPAKPEGYGSAVNGGELLFLALATCFCNDVYREAARRNMAIDLVEVMVTGEFGQEGEPATNITYEVSILAPEQSQEEIASLTHHVDKVAEVHNTLRKGVRVTLKV